MHYIQRFFKPTGVSVPIAICAVATRRPFTRPIVKVREPKIFADDKAREQYESTHHAHLHKKLVFLSSLRRDPDLYTVVQETERPTEQVCQTDL